MKKLSLLIMPLMVVSFLVSCGNSPQPQAIDHFVSFETYGGTHIETQRVKNGEKAVKPNTPIRKEDTFKYWLTNSGDEYTFDEPVTDDITLFAYWEVSPDPQLSRVFKFSGKGCKVGGMSNFTCNVLIGDNPSFAIVPESGYLLPTDITIKKGSNVYYVASVGTIFVTSMVDDVEIEATAIPTTPAADSFENDLWETFLNEIDGKTYSQITRPTSPYYDEWHKNDDSFVGLHRTLTIENQKGETDSYQVLTVDENKNAGENDAKFTFMILDLNHEMAFSLSDNFYPNSNIHSYLNGVLCGFPTIVKQHIPTVSIECYNPDPSDPKIVSIATSLYIPSASQIFGNDITPKENNQFAYFSDGESKSVLNGAWLRTPDTVAKKVGKYVNNGEISDDFITESHLVMPVFNIK